MNLARLKGIMSARYRAICIRDKIPELNTYMNAERGYGAGDIRLDQTLEMDDSIYSLGFLC